MNQHPADPSQVRLNPREQKRQKDSRSPKPVGIDVAPVRAKRLGLRLSFCRFCLEDFQRPTVLITPPFADVLPLSQEMILIGDGDLIFTFRISVPRLG